MSYINALDAARSKGQVLRVSHLPSGKTVSVTAFVESWNDSFSSNWNRENVYGRMDPIQNFQNTQRTISVTFKLVAATSKEAKDNLASVSQMIQFLYPSYKGLSDGITAGYAISGAPILSVKYMNLITETDGTSLAGTMDGIDHSFDLDAGFFEEDTQIYPKALNISFTFHPLHKGTKGYLNNVPLDNAYPYVNSALPPQESPEAFAVAAEELNGGQSIPQEIQESEQQQVLGSGLGQTVFTE